jgi:hypothetical protein
VEVLSGVVVSAFPHPLSSFLFFVARTLAFSVPQLQGVSLFQTLKVAAVGAEPGQGQVHPTIKRKFLPQYFKTNRALLIAFSLMGATDNFIDNRVGNIAYIIRQKFRL